MTSPDATTVSRADALIVPTNGDTNSAFASWGTEIISEFCASSRENFIRSAQSLTFDGFLSKLVENPYLYLRNVGAYTCDAIRHYGSLGMKRILGQEIEVFKALSCPWEEEEGLTTRTTLHGLEIPLFRFYQVCEDFAKQPRADRMVVFWGQNGVGKSTLGRAIDSLLEHYSSEVPEGALYQLVWVFDDVPASLRVRMDGFSKRAPDNGESEDDQPFKIPASLHTNPFFVLPTGKSNGRVRERVIERLKTTQHWNESINVDFLMRGSLDSTSQAIFEALMMHHNGDLKKVLQHVKCERWTLSAQVGRGLAHIQPTGAAASKVEQRFPREILERQIVPAALEGREHTIHHVDGLFPNAARGHVYMEDMFMAAGSLGSRIGALLPFFETGSIQVSARSTEGLLRHEKMELLVRGDTAIPDLVKVWGKSMLSGLGVRTEWIDVPSILRYRTELTGLEPVLKERLGTTTPIGPHALNTFALFIVATRLLEINSDEFSEDNSELAKALQRAKITTVEKALLYDEQTSIEVVNSIREATEQAPIGAHDLEMINTNLSKIVDQFSPVLPEGLWLPREGHIGISFRVARNMLRRLASAVSRKEGGEFSVPAVIEFLEKHEEKGFPYFKELEARKQGYHRSLEKERGEQVEDDDAELNDKFPITDPQVVIDEVISFAEGMIKSDVHSVLGLSKNEAALSLLKKYFAHLKVLITKSGDVPVEFRDSRMGDDGSPDERFMQQFEDENIPKFRGQRVSRSYERQILMNHIVGWSSANQGANTFDALDKIFPDIFGQILSRTQRTTENSKKVSAFRESCMVYTSNPSQLEADRMGDLQQKEKARVWDRAVELLLKRGYPNEISIATNVLWAYRNEI